MTRISTTIVITAMMTGFFLSLFGGDLFAALPFAIGGAVFITAHVRRERA
ncbi:hypothetical protein [Stakelama pacifica]|uniref:Uncharacterized protein n=1 Tax=Stakelama pacifica TaxID=517720 RepID=A0A4R6FJU3_9SPHN|nr:hypothetical protein [Stakelama pacifica]TDN81739.1 hypothetical protein EV664_107141 [Stakelama pacifica]GGO96421.1 hypothetical protein GCM10011329_22910 [Stakelama pacifica]